MNRVIRTLPLLFFLVAAPLSAQMSAEFEKTREAMQRQKDEVIAADMKLTDEEGKAFWPLYREYQAAMRKLQDRYFRLLAEYAKERENETFTDRKAKALLDEYMAIEEETLSLKRTYLERFKRLFPTKKVMRYFQLENRIAAGFHYQATQMIPLAK
ncbi:MAG: hypothetical protein HXY45_20395 [Syntrophaceae bacterium]|nr:hypothetical protein [Syntrophaceae bacterium]